jgi:hypothetical protein
MQLLMSSIRLPICSFHCFDLVCCVEFFDLIAQLSVAEQIRRVHDLGAGKRTTSFLHRIPMSEHKLPRQLLAGGIVHHSVDQVYSILRAKFRRDGELKRSPKKFGIVELRQREQDGVVPPRGPRQLTQPKFPAVAENRAESSSSMGLFQTSMGSRDNR